MVVTPRGRRAASAYRGRRSRDQYARELEAAIRAERLRYAPAT